MKHLIALLLLLVCSPASAEIKYAGSSGQTVYARIEVDASTFFTVPLTAGTGSKIGTYSATDAAILAAAPDDTLAANRGLGYFFTVRSGAESTTADDTILGAQYLRWSGTREVDDSRIPINQTRIPPARTWTLLQRGDEGLVGDKTIGMTVGNTKTFSIKFAADLATNGQLVSVDSVEIVSGDDEGLEFDVDFEGVDRDEAKVKIEALAADTYEIEATVSYDDNDGGGSSTGVVELVVSETAAE